MSWSPVVAVIEGQDVRFGIIIAEVADGVGAQPEPATVPLQVLFESISATRLHSPITTLC